MFNLILILIIVWFGLSIGSFLNVIIFRLPRRQSIIYPPSCCPNCTHRLGFFDLIPILSFLCLKGRCRYCKVKIDLRYPLVEFITGLITVIAWFRFGCTISGAVFLGMSYILIPIAFINLELKIIPDWLSLPLLVSGLIWRFWSGDFGIGLLGLLVGGGILGLIALIYPQGMGWGDVKLLAAIGVFLNWQKVCYILFLASLLGIIIILPMILFKKMEQRQQFPFGPFLVLATMCIIYWPK